MTHAVLVALTGDLEQEVVAAVDGTGDLAVVRRCADIAELVAAALAGLGVVALVDADLDPDRALIARLARAGTTTVVVADERDHDRVAAMGAVPVGPGVTDIVEAAVAAATAAPTASSDPHPADAPPAEATDDQRAGRMVAVWGPPGAPGRTTVAINLAAEIAATEHRVLLVDADVWGASIAASLGILEDSAGLAAAVRAADRGTLDLPSLGRLCVTVSDRLRVLPGLPRPHRWREVSGAGIDAVWEVGVQAADWVVVETGVWVPDDEAAGFDAVLGRRRNAVTSSVLAAAEALVVVGAAEPIGIQRLVQTLLDLEERGGAPARRHVAVTRARVDAAGPRPQESVREALHRFAGVDDPVVIPDDRPALDRACLAGATLAESAPRSPARLAIAGLATQLTGVDPATRRGRRKRPRRSVGSWL